MAKRGFFDADELALFGPNGLFMQALLAWCFEYNAFLCTSSSFNTSRVYIEVRHGVLAALATRMKHSEWMPSFEDERRPKDYIAVACLAANGVDGFDVVMKLELEGSRMMRVFDSLLTAIGGYAIELSYESRLEGHQVISQAVATHCVNLECLKLEHCGLTSRDAAPLFHALRTGTLARTLVRLCLNRNELTDADTVALADILKCRERESALQFLFLSGNERVTAVGINALGDALQVNRTLVFLLCQGSGSSVV